MTVSVLSTPLKLWGPRVGNLLVAGGGRLGGLVITGVLRLRCRLRIQGHEFEVVRKPPRLYLACLNCGRETPGIVLDAPQPRLRRA